MKIRNGFVSNSSSSSFIIHKSAFKNSKDWDEFIDRLNEIKTNEKKSSDYWDNSWGDSGNTFTTNKNFVIVEAMHAPEEVHSLLDEYNLDNDNQNVCIEYS